MCDNLKMPLSIREMVLHFPLVKRMYGNHITVKMSDRMYLH